MNESNAELKKFPIVTRKHLLFSIAVLVVVASTSCFLNSGPIHSRQIGEKFVLGANDVRAEMALWRFADDDPPMEVVGPTIVAIGFNARFIIVKQVPLRHQNDRTAVFYVISTSPGAGGWSEKENVYGPLSEPEFANVRIALEVPESLRFQPKLMN